MVIKYGTNINEGVLGAFCVSLALFGMIHLSLYISGGCLNPAVALVQSIFQNIVFPSIKDEVHSYFNNRYSDFSNVGYEVTLKSMWIYILGPISGGVIAGFFAVFNSFG